MERRSNKLIKANVLGYKSVEFTHHALLQMNVRQISEKQVLDTIREPEETGLTTQPGRHRVRRSIDQYRYCDVVYVLMEDRIAVVTAISIQKHKPKPLIDRRRK